MSRIRLACWLLCWLFCWLAAPLPARADRMSPELLWKLGRLQGGTLSPDGRRVAYAVRRYDLAKNRGHSSVFVAPLDGGAARCVSSGLPQVSDLQWGVFGGKDGLFFVGKKDAGATSQVWRLDPRSRKRSVVTDVETGVHHLKVSPTGSHLAFTTRVRLDPQLVDRYPDLPEARAEIIDTLMYRHWNRWHDGTYSHLFVAPVDADGKVGTAVDLMAGLRFDCPLPPWAGSEHFAWSPDGREIAFTSKMVNDPAMSTDSDIYLVAVDGSRQIRSITAGMNGYDAEPVYSPDGGRLAFLSMERPGFEADRSRIMVCDRTSGRITDVTRGLDQTAHEVHWAPDGQSLFFASEWRGTRQLFRVSLATGDVRPVTGGRYDWEIRDVAPDGAGLLAARRDMLRPRELVTVALHDGDVKPVTDINGAIYANLELPSVEERWTRSTDGARVHNWIIFPPDFDPKKRWPLLTYCQGGPQGQIGQWFSYRWNFHLMAARGYIVLATNRRGLPGFGRAWNDQISGDWGGQAMQDILAATDAMLATPYVDNRKVAAIGASYGGYSVYWLMGHHANRFCAMISHCGAFNLESMYGSTEELFFVNWDLGGPYWKNEKLRREYDRFSPHRFVRNWKTPLLVIHGEKDFRVPVTQAMEAFTAAQSEGVPSRFLYFPEEGHWVLGPQNGVLWHRVFFEWLDRWCR